MSSLSTLRSLTRGELKNVDPNGRVWSDSEIDNAVNNAFADVQAAGNFDWPANQKATTVPVVAGTAEYALPTGFVSVKALRGVSLRPMPVTYAQVVLAGPASGTPWGFYLYGDKLGLYPTPVAGDTLSMAYAAAHPKLTDSVPCAFAEEFDQAIACRAAYYVVRSRPNMSDMAERKKRQSDDDIASLFASNRFRASGAYGTF